MILDKLTNDVTKASHYSIPVNHSGFSTKNRKLAFCYIEIRLLTESLKNSQ